MSLWCTVCKIQKLIGQTEEKKTEVKNKIKEKNTLLFQTKRLNVISLRMCFKVCNTKKMKFTRPNGTVQNLTKKKKKKECRENEKINCTGIPKKAFVRKRFARV